VNAHPRTVFIVAVLSVTMEQANVAQDPRQTFYWSGGKRVPITVVPNVVAAEGNRTAARTAVGNFADG
jgi:hypothetical protein